MNWKDEIVKLVYVKQELAKVDKTGLWPHRLPAVATDRLHIAEIEKLLGFNLDQNYVNFLLHANGWEGVYQSVDLLAVEDLLDTSKSKYAHMVFASIDDHVVAQSGFKKDELIPIAATPYDKDIFLLAKPNSSEPGAVVWFAGDLIDKFANFEEFFLAMIDCNRAEIDYFKKQNI